MNEFRFKGYFLPRATAFKIFQLFPPAFSAIRPKNTIIAAEQCRLFPIFFKGVEDPRTSHATKHDLHDMLVIGLMTSICGGWRMYRHGRLWPRKGRVPPVVSQVETWHPQSWCVVQPVQKHWPQGASNSCSPFGQRMAGLFRERCHCDWRECLASVLYSRVQALETMKVFNFSQWEGLPLILKSRLFWPLFRVWLGLNPPSNHHHLTVTLKNLNKTLISGSFWPKYTTNTHDPRNHHTRPSWTHHPSLTIRDKSGDINRG